MKWLIIGAGVSGLGAAKLLASRGEDASISDGGHPAEQTKKILRELGVNLFEGGHELSHLDGIEKLVISPGISPTNPLYQRAITEKIPTISEIDLALENYQGKVIAVSGTNGKSTVCAMTGHVLSQLGLDVSIGGNFGDPPSALIAEGRMKDRLVLELSSYQLELSNSIFPSASMLTSFSEDHLARHKTIKGYLGAKWKIFANNNSKSISILTSQIESLAQSMSMPEIQGRRYVLHETIEGCSSSETCIPFEVTQGILQTTSGLKLNLNRTGIIQSHDLVNISFAILTAMELFETTSEDTVNAAAGYKGLPHRCECIGYLNEKPVINDSKSTNMESTLVALSSQKEPVVLLIGGEGKKEDYSGLSAQKDKIALAITFGASGKEIQNQIPDQIQTRCYPTLKDVLHDIKNLMTKYKAPVLLSPACASFDEFRNFEERGDFFRTNMAKLMD